MRSALIVAHGFPSSPASAERAVRELAARVAGDLAGWTVEGVTLAAPGALEAALAELPDRHPLIYPFFMADGWFVRERLPAKLRACGMQRFDLLRPLGRDPALHRLCLDHAREAATAAGLSARDTALLLAAHGSPSDPRPREAVEEAAGVIGTARAFREVRVGFIDEPPFLCEAAALDGPALCLPFFAGRAGHVEVDLPEALSAAAFPGRLLDAIGLHRDVAAIVTAALSAAAARRAA